MSARAQLCALRVHTRRRDRCRLARDVAICGVTSQSSSSPIRAGDDLDRMLRLACRQASLAVLRRYVARPPARCAARPAGNPRRDGRAPADAAVRNTGRPTFTATSCVAFTTPNVPPWPEQRSITSTGVSGIRRSISAALGPMFCARAWQARCTVTPSGSGFSPAGRPSFFAMSTTYSSMSKVVCRDALHVFDCPARSAAIRISASGRRTP